MTVECRRPPVAVDRRLVPERGQLAVTYEDTDLVVLDKPPGLTVHPGAGHDTGTLAHLLVGAYPEIAEVGSPERPGIVHRLDQGTSGLLVVARSERAYRGLSAAFSESRVAKSYLAMVYGNPQPESGTVDQPIGRHPHDRTRMAVRPDGRPSITHFKTLDRADGVALLEIDLATGRTHQIRVHMKHIRHPLVGDSTYGEARWKALERRVRNPLRDFPRPALHAWRLAFAHPASGEQLQFVAPVPEDMRRLWRVVASRDMPPGTR